MYDVDFRGADKEAKDIDDYTPLLTAIEFGQKEAFECLMKESDDVQITAQNKDKKSTLFLAAESNHPEIAKVSCMTLGRLYYNNIAVLSRQAERFLCMCSVHSCIPTQFL